MFTERKKILVRELHLRVKDNTYPCSLSSYTDKFGTAPDNACTFSTPACSAVPQHVRISHYPSYSSTNHLYFRVLQGSMRQLRNEAGGWGQPCLFKKMNSVSPLTFKQFFVPKHKESPPHQHQQDRNQVEIYLVKYHLSE